MPLYTTIVEFKGTVYIISPLDVSTLHTDCSQLNCVFLSLQITVAVEKKLATVNNQYVIEDVIEAQK